MKKFAFVTGAAQGIGKAVSISLAKEGYDLAINDIKNDRCLQTTVDEILKIGRNVVVLPEEDISDLSKHKSMIEKIKKEYKGIDCLVNNAGVSVKNRGDLLKVSIDSYNRCLDTNTRGSFFLTQKIALEMLKRPATNGIHRCIIFITSANADAASVDRGEYCISKAGLSMIARLFALRLANEGIGVYEIQPGLIRTQMTEPSKEKYDKLIAEGMIPIKRWGTPEDIAKIVTTISKGGLPYTVGEKIRVDGGLNVKRF